MNLILEKDGILGYIGTRSEFGLYLAQLDKSTAEGITPSWTSCPVHTILSMLGLSLRMEIPGKPEVVFYGSPLTLMLTALIRHRNDDWLLDCLHMRAERGVATEVSRWDVGAVNKTGVPIFPVEYQRALSYYRELNTPFGPQQTERTYVGVSTLRIS
jgi:hypothetical protein